VRDDLVLKAEREVPLMHLRNLTGELLSLKAQSDSLAVEYFSPAPCWISIDTEPIAITIDGKQMELSPIKQYLQQDMLKDIQKYVQKFQKLPAETMKPVWDIYNKGRIPCYEGIGDRKGLVAWQVRCPAGRHTVVLAAASSALYHTEVISALSFWVIVIFSTTSCSLLFVLIIITHLENRRRREAKKQVRV
jgi:hypothetical protein